MCESKPVTFRYIAGRENFADYISRPISYNKLKLTNYYSGPELLGSMEEQPDIQLTVPAPFSGSSVPGEVTLQTATVAAALVGDAGDSCLERLNPLVTYDKYSSFNKLVRIHANVLKFLHKLKLRIGKVTSLEPEPNYIKLASDTVIRIDQAVHFPEVVEFFNSKNSTKKLPNLVLQMNLFLDSESVIRVKSKFRDGNHPILLATKSHLSRIIVTDLHYKMSHAGLYTTLRSLRKTFWLLRGFSTVRKILRNCITCKKINERPVKLNQASYRDFRSDPPKIPFSTVFTDYIGPLTVKVEGKSKKVWLLLITCLWTRAVSLQICQSADTREFLRNLQIHINKFGLFSVFFSDLGSQIVAGSNLISNFLDDIECHNYFQASGINRVVFSQYAKGNSELGSLVECLVKQTKNLINKSIGRNVLDYVEFELLIAKVSNIINRRPIAFQSSLRSDSIHDEWVDSITPEMLLFGRELHSINVIPALQEDSTLDPSYSPVESVKLEYSRLKKVNEKLKEVYHSEFLGQLISQAVDRNDRYKPVVHKLLLVGDIVLLVEPNTKQSCYPLGIVRKVITNTLGEVTAAFVYKGKTEEEVFRHASSIILLLKNESDEGCIDGDNVVNKEISSRRATTVRQTALAAREKIKTLL